MNIDHKHCAYALMRISFGLIFMVTGIEKLVMGPNVFADKLVGQFSNTGLPLELVRVFGAILPFVEVVAGVLIALGIFTMAGLSLAALLLMALTFGMLMLKETAVVAQNLLYSLTSFFLIFYLEFNAFALERRWENLRIGVPRVDNIPVASTPGAASQVVNPPPSKRSWFKF